MTQNEDKKKTKLKKPKRHKGSAHGAVPFIRWSFSCLAVIAISLAVGIGSQYEIFLVRRQRFSDSSDVLTWIFTSMTIPYVVLYIVVFVSSFLILSQSSFRYVWWVIKQAASATLSYAVITIVLSAMLLGVAFAVSQPSVTAASNTNEFAANQMWVAGHMAAAVVAWGGYRSAWKIYRVIGAQTMQQRYEADVEKMEIKTSGRFWDKWVIRPLRWFFAKDGSRPRFGFFYGAITIILTIVATSSVTVLGMNFLMPIALLSIPAIIVLLWAAISKYQDGRYNQLKPPVLDKVRDKNTEDTYNPESKGHRVFPAFRNA